MENKKCPSCNMEMQENGGGFYICMNKNCEATGREGQEKRFMIRKCIRCGKEYNYSKKPLVMQCEDCLGVIGRQLEALTRPRTLGEFDKEMAERK